MGEFKIKPFDFQQKAVDTVLNYWDEGLQSVLLQSPPSSGKTVMASILINILKQTDARRIFFFVHLEDLFGSTAKALSSFFSVKQVDISNNVRTSGEIHVCMVQTFKSRFEDKYREVAEIKKLARKGYKHYLNEDVTSLCIFDECHRGDHDQVIEHLRENCKGIKILGLSGTPKKVKGARLPLSKAYDKKVVTVSEIELIQLGRTVPPYIIRPESEGQLDLSHVPIQKSGFNKGEYNQGALSKHMREKRFVYTGLEKLYKQYCDGLKMLVFCVDVAHAIDMAEHLNRAGISSKFYASGKTKPKLEQDASPKQVERYNRRLEVFEKFEQAKRDRITGGKREILNQWGRDFQVLVNVGVFTTGFDDDDIMVVADCAPTKSENLYLQKEGRGKRIKDGKTFFYYIDMAENIRTFGHPCAPRDYPLQESERKKKGSGDAPTKKCPECGQSIPASDIVCESPIFDGFIPTGEICGYIFPIRRLERETKFTLIKWGKLEQMPAPLAVAEFKKTKKTTISDVYEYFSSRKSSPKPLRPEWLFYTLYELFGRDGLVEFAEDTGRNPDKFLENVQRFTGGGINVV